MPNPENITSLSREQLKSNGRKGGIKSAKVRKQKMLMAEELKLILALPVNSKVNNIANKLLTSDKAKALADFNKRNTTVQTQILLKLTEMSMRGNTKAIELILDITGENKQKTVDTSALDKLDTIIGGLENAAYSDVEVKDGSDT